jgi:hypothetical protein
MALTVSLLLGCTVAKPPDTRNRSLSNAAGNRE